ncbi:hypothetical protein ACHAWC_008951 [Mediolabrus comicus]
MLLRYLSSSSSTATSCLVVQLRKISSASSSTTTLLRSQSSFSCRYNLAPNNIHYTATNNNCNRRLFHNSAIRLASNDNDNVYVSLETASSSSSKSNNIDSSNSSSSGSSCSQEIPLDENNDDEEEQEEMFVVADPILGHGTRKEWGGPRRGGSLAEPTRFGDWERKGRCTDF